MVVVINIIVAKILIELDQNSSLPLVRDEGDAGTPTPIGILAAEEFEARLVVVDFHSVRPAGIADGDFELAAGAFAPHVFSEFDTVFREEAVARAEVARAVLLQLRHDIFHSRKSKESAQPVVFASFLHTLGKKYVIGKRIVNSL